jgi:8-oxo-dGTP diphosphatase
MVCADCIVIAGAEGRMELLLILRKNEPYAGTWALPGGFVDMDEDLEDSAKRELCEETGIVLDKMDQFAAYGKPGRDPRGRNISVVYYQFLSGVPEIKAGDDAAEAKWFPLADLPVLAFDHKRIVDDFVKSHLK